MNVRLPQYVIHPSTLFSLPFSRPLIPYFLSNMMYPRPPGPIPQLPALRLPHGFHTGYLLPKGTMFSTYSLSPGSIWICSMNQWCIGNISGLVGANFLIIVIHSLIKSRSPHSNFDASLVSATLSLERVALRSALSSVP